MIRPRLQAAFCRFLLLLLSQSFFSFSIAQGNGAVAAPRPAVDLKPGSYHYRVILANGGEKTAIMVTTTIADAGATWTATNAMQTTAGISIETATIEKTSLILKKRDMTQGPLLMSVDFADNKASGKYTMNGINRPVAADLGGPLFADAAGSDQVLATLPLAPGYTASFRNFDVLTQKVKLQQFAVTGSESLTVPAGKFDAYRVEITTTGNADKKTLWIAKDSRKVVKITATMASLGGATLTQDLTQ